MIAEMLLALAMASPQASLPREVSAYIARRDACDHFRGEASPDARRQAEIERAAAQLCAGSDAQLARLKRVHARNRAVRRSLARYDSRIEG